MDNLIVLYGGESVERDISVITAVQVMRNIDTKHHKVYAIYMLGNEMYLVSNKFALEMSVYAKATHSNIDSKVFSRCVIIDGNLIQLKRNKLKCICPIDCVVVCCHGGSGENGELQGMLEMNKIPYTSANVKASAICMDKAITHKFASRINIRNTKFTLINMANTYDVERIFTALSGESEGLVVKPNSLGSSIGIGVATSVDELKENIIKASLYDNNIIIETKVNNLLEFNCACLATSRGILVSNVDCPIAKSQILSFEDKYIEGSKYISPNVDSELDIDEAIINKIKQSTEKLYKEIGLYGVVRIDYLYNTATGELFLNEINTIPGSMAYYLFDGLGYTMRELIKEMIDMAYARSSQQKRLIKQFKSSVLSRNIKCAGKLLQK